jgi:hypothetical protein
LVSSSLSSKLLTALINFIKYKCKLSPGLELPPINMTLGIIPKALGLFLSTTFALAIIYFKSRYFLIT